MRERDQPNPFGASKEHERDQPVENDDDKDHQQRGFGDLGRIPAPVEKHFVPHQHCYGRGCKLLQHRHREREAFAAHAYVRLHFLLERFQVFLELAREEFPHLGVHALHVGDEREQPHQDGDGDNDSRRHRLPSARSVNDSGSASFLRKRCSSRAMEPSSLSWSCPFKCSAPCNIKIFNSSPIPCPRARAFCFASGSEMAISPPSNDGKESTSVVLSFRRKRRFNSRILRSLVNRTFTSPCRFASRRATATKRSSALGETSATLASMITTVPLKKKGGRGCPPIPL